MRLRWIPTALAFVGGVLVTEFASDYVAESTSIEFFSKLLTLEIPVSLVSAILAGLGFLTVIYLYFEERTRLLQADVEDLSSKVATAQSRLHDLNLARYLDRTTRIPNELKWQEDIVEFGQAASKGKPCHLAMIDLVDFGRLNNTIGYSATDDVIRFIAQDFFQTMRRNESVYKTEIRDADESYFRQRVYRKFSGGDEFLILVNGPEYEVLGLINRLAKEAGKYTAFAASKSVDWTFAFHAGVCPVERMDTPELARKRVEECLSVAKRDDRLSPIYWHSEMEVDSPDDQRWNTLPEFAKTIYRQALDPFPKDT